MKKLKKVLSLSLCMSLIAVLLTAVLVFAEDVTGANGSTADEFVWVPVVKGAEVMNNLMSVKDSDADAQISLDEDNSSVKLTFTSDTDDVSNRKVTEVHLDTSKVPGKMHYVSFDLSIDSFMDFVATMDLPEVENLRPYSLYIGQHDVTSEGNTATYCKAGALQHDPDKHFVKDGDLVGNVAWLTNDAVKGVGMRENQEINVKILSEADFSLNNTNVLQPMYVYINGVRGGQPAYADKTKANQMFNYDTLRFIHYATKSGTETVTLKNLEMGYAKTDDLYVTESYATSNDTEKFRNWENKTGVEFIRYYIYNPNNYRWIIYPNKIQNGGIASENVSVIWTNQENDNWGLIIGSKQRLDINSTKLTGSFAPAFSWNETKGCVDNDDGTGWLAKSGMSWKDDKNVIVTYILDYDNKTLTADCNGLSVTTNLLDSAPEGETGTPFLQQIADNATLKCFYADGTGTTKYDGAIVSKVEHGWFKLNKGMNITDTSGKDISTIDGKTSAGVTVFENTNSEAATVLLAQYDSNGNLICVTIKDILVVDGVCRFAPLKSESVDNQFAIDDSAVKLRAFLFDSLNGLRPLTGYDEVVDNVAS